MNRELDYNTCLECGIPISSEVIYCNDCPCIEEDQNDDRGNV